MHEVWAITAVWIALALAAALIAGWLRITTALSEIIVGIFASWIATQFLGINLGSDLEWIKFLAGAGAIALTFLAGAELDPDILRTRFKEATVIGILSFLAPFLGCAAASYYILGWDERASWLAGVALSTTSVAIVYAVMLELGLNKTAFGKTILAATFITDLGTVIVLGLIFSPFTYKTLIFVIVSIVFFIILPYITPRFLKKYENRPSEIEAKYLFLFLFILGALAVWSESEAVLPAYVMGMVLAGTVGRDHLFIRRLRTLTFGLLTPFYFIRAGSYVSIPAIYTAPIPLLILFMSKLITKSLGVYPSTKFYRYEKREAVFTTLLMSTGLTFGSIAAIYGLTNGIVDQMQYSLLIAAIIGSAIIPTVIATTFFIPYHLLSKREDQLREKDK
ncbi:MAG: cation:proton antiporter [Thermodesulfovibrionales bacterium]|nr:cation:proton antiporter [Thermodesulfovibrionales bacterium]